MPSSAFWVGPVAHPDTYRLVELIGGGAEGEVWRGVLPLSAGGRRDVAIKIARGVGGAEEERDWTRFGHLITSLGHPGLVRVTDVFVGPERHREGLAAPGAVFRYVVMDHLRGRTLRAWTDENPHASAADRLQKLRTAASALDEMHSGAATTEPVAHGDVKPANIVVTDDDGAVVLVDLGLARLTDSPGVRGRSALYAAPELRHADALATPASDRFAFVVTTAQVLLGEPPPADPEGGLDPVALGSLLAAHPVTGTRPALARAILDALACPPDERPAMLRPWLDALSDGLAQTTLLGSAAAASWSGAPAPPGVNDRTRPLRDQPLRPARRSHRGVAVAAVSALVVAAAVLLLTLPTLRGSDGAAAAPPPAVPPTAVPPPAVPIATTAPDPGRSTSVEATGTGGPTSQVVARSADPVPAGRNTYLADTPHAEGSTPYRGSIAISGRPYVHSVFQIGREGSPVATQFDLRRQCAELTLTAGITDDSSSEAIARFEVYGDDRLLASTELGHGTGERFTVDVSGVLRLTLQNVLISSPNAYFRAGWGDAAVRCTASLE